MTLDDFVSFLENKYAADKIEDPVSQRLLRNEEFMATLPNQFKAYENVVFKDQGPPIHLVIVGDGEIRLYRIRKYRQTQSRPGKARDTRRLRDACNTAVETYQFEPSQLLTVKYYSGEEAFEMSRIYPDKTVPPDTIVAKTPFR